MEIRCIWLVKMKQTHNLLLLVTFALKLSNSRQCSHQSSDSELSDGWYLLRGQQGKEMLQDGVLRVQQVVGHDPTSQGCVGHVA